MIRPIPPRCLSWLLLLNAGCFVPSQRLARNEPFRAARVALPAAGLTRLVIDAAVGNVSIDSLTTDSVIVRADLASHDAKRLANECGPNTRLVQSRSGSELHVRLDQQTRNRCGERWNVSVPANVGVRVEGSVTDVVVAASLNQLHVRLRGPGSVRGYVNSPDIDVNTNLGDITLTAARREFGRVSAVSRIGSARLEVNGLRISSISRPPGSVAEVEGKGRATLIARSGNGTVRVTVE
jgi:hypothetical protein